MHLRILGTRGVPASHGGFETFAEHLSLYLVKKGWKVTVYCQDDASGLLREDVWQGVNRVIIPVNVPGPKGTMLFDWLCIKHASKSKDLVLTLGYNTASFCLFFRFLGIPNVINMDGIEWKRKKWKGLAKLWFYLNDWAGCWIGNHLIADHPEIKRHLSTRASPKKITMIPYGADLVTTGTKGHLEKYGLIPFEYMTVIARPEPENSVLEIVKAFSASKRGKKLVVLGNYADSNPYHAEVKAAAGDEVLFLGAIYDTSVVRSLRYYSLAYVHGHQVGGTNPSLVEALGAGNAVIAHDNQFNRWVAGPEAMFFSCVADCAMAFDDLLSLPSKLDVMRNSSLERHRQLFEWESVLGQYESLFISISDCSFEPREASGPLRREIAASEEEFLQ